MLGNQPPASFGLIARQFLYVMSRIQSPLCTYCRRWPCSDHLDSCRLCRCCFQISQFGRDQSLTEQRYLDLVARLTVILGELAAHSSWPWELGRSTESQSRPQHHRRVRSSSRSSSDRSPLRRRIGCQIEKEERHKENREARSSPTPKPRSSRGQETWTPTLRHRRTPSPNFPIFSAQPALELRPAPRPPPKQEGVQAASHYNTPPPPPPPKRTTENNQVARGERQETPREGKGKGGKGSGRGDKKPKKKNRGKQRKIYWAARCEAKGKGKGQSKTDTPPNQAPQDCVPSPSLEDSPSSEEPSEESGAEELGKKKGGDQPQLTSERIPSWADASQETSS